MRDRLFLALALVCLSACAGGSSATPTPILDPLAAQGQSIFKQNCAVCHAVSPDTMIVGPSLAGVADRAATRLPDLDARQYLQQSILEPGAFVVKGFSDVMPRDFGQKLTDGNLDALLAYLLTLE